ncbi:Protein MCM10 [Gossypium australe]|uniref:Protein MCM10 n=1 Tax=Gossypium australe TaxID=47621 RepID=A0A5B6WIH8_9ROSI|nr:Protein MCM10 [Gossypium australe]
MLYNPVLATDTVMSSNQARAESEEAECIAQALVQIATSSSSRRPEFEGRVEEAKEAFFQIMNEWFTEFLRTNPVVQQPPPPAPQPVPDMPQGAEPDRTVVEYLDFCCTKGNTWEFFQIEFRKKYIIQRFLDQKKKEFLDLKQGNTTISEYEQEFVRLSK